MSVFFGAMLISALFGAMLIVHFKTDRSYPMRVQL